MSAQQNDRTGGHTILLGGIGGDSHSVGLNILRQALRLNGYKVLYLGTQNCLESFFEHAWLSNVVMLSSMDGHTRYYLRAFPDLLKRFRPQRSLWYLGGNLHIGDAYGYEAYFRQMGFDRVFVKFTDVSRVLELLEHDLSGVQANPDCSALWAKSQQVSAYDGGTVADDLLEPDKFESSRREVLEYWKTGHKARDLDENAEFLGRQASFPRAQSFLGGGRRPVLIQPRSGVPLLDEQIKLFSAFKRAGASVLSYQVDSLTRNNDYTGAEEALRESAASGVPTLNGFPVINHGVPGLRRVIREINLPLQTRHSTRDPRLLAEVSYAGGVTAFEGGAICYNIPYYRDYKLSESIKTWQYVDRLTGLYYERFGIALDREFFGTLTGTLIPPCLAITVGLIEAILAIRQGVKCVSLGYAEQGHRIQDIAAVRTLGQMAREIFTGLGFKDVQVNTVYHQYMAAFPQSRDRAEELIYKSAITAGLSRATRILVKTPVEAIKIPTLEDNIAGISLVKNGVSAAQWVQVDEPRVAEECAIIRKEVTSIFDSLIVRGKGSLAQGVVSGFHDGLIDIPFAPSIHNRGNVVTARDVEGAVRFLSPGCLPFDRDLREFHEARMAARRRQEGLMSKQQDYLLVEQDVLQLPRHQYAGWPLFE